MLDNAIASSSLKTLESCFRGRIGGRIVHLRRAPSTMDVARGMVEDADFADSVHGTVVIADEQSRGRGRFGRAWDSKSGEDILASVILCPRLSITGKLTIITSLAAALTIDAITKSKSVIKWPNDVLLDRKKICGVLAESVTTGNTFVGIVGIGLNVNRRNDFGEDRGYFATSIRDALNSDGAIDRRDVARVLLCNLNELYDALDRGESIMPEWREKLVGLGAPVEVMMASQQDSEVIAGIAEDVDEFGRLLIRQPDGVMLAVAAGEVTTMGNNISSGR